MKRADIAFLLILAGTFALSRMEAQSPAQPFVCETPCPIPAERAAKLYWYVTAQVAREISPDRPPKLQPRIKVIIDPKSSEGYLLEPELVTLRMKEWNENYFAQCVALAASTQILSTQRRQAAIRGALVFLNATVTASDLKASK
jgi:hypothetical protein